MTISTIYGNEKCTPEFLNLLQEKGIDLESLIGPDDAADKFIDAALLTDFLIPEMQKYFENINALCLKLAKDHEEFYERLTEKIKELDPETIPAKAILFLYSQ